MKTHEEQKEQQIAPEVRDRTASQIEPQTHNKHSPLKLDDLRVSRAAYHTRIKRQSPRFSPVMGSKKRWSICSPEPRPLPLEVVKLLTPCKQILPRKVNRLQTVSIQDKNMHENLGNLCLRNFQFEHTTLQKVRNTKGTVKKRQHTISRLENTRRENRKAS